MHHIIASHLTKHYIARFAHHLLPFNFVVGVDEGMDFAIKATALKMKKYIQLRQTRGELPTKAAVFLDLKNIFNLVSRKKLMAVITKIFPKLLPFTTLLYGDSGTVNLRWDDRSWQSIEMEEGVNQGCPLSSIFAALVLNKILVPLDKILQERAVKHALQQGPGEDGQGGSTHQIGFVDNLGATVILEDVLFFIEKFDVLARPFGYLLNTFKTRIFTS